MTRVTATQVKLTYIIKNIDSVRVTNLKQINASLTLSSPVLTVGGTPSAATISAALEPGLSVTKIVTFTNTRLTTGTSANLALTIAADGGYSHRLEE